MKINLNAMCRVILTAAGSDIYNEWNDRLFFDRDLNRPAPARTVVGSELKTEMWQLWAIFGQQCYMGNTKQPFFKDNSIEVIKQ